MPENAQADDRQEVTDHVSQVFNETMGAIIASREAMPADTLFGARFYHRGEWTRFSQSRYWLSLGDNEGRDVNNEEQLWVALREALRAAAYIVNAIHDTRARGFYHEERT